MPGIVVFFHWLAVLCYAGVIFFLSSLPGTTLPQQLVLSDFTLHIIEYLPLGFLMARAMQHTKASSSKKAMFLLCCILAIVYAISDEIHQLFVPGRQASPFDLIADSIGAFIGVKFIL